MKHLINAFTLYKENFKKFCWFLDEVDGYICRDDNVSGKLKDKFHLKGTYYSFYNKLVKALPDNVEPFSNYTYVFYAPEYKGFHYHFSMFQFIEGLEVVKNKLHYKGEIITKKILKQINIDVTNKLKSKYDYVFELYGSTNNLILL